MPVRCLTCREEIEAAYERGRSMGRIEQAVETTMNAAEPVALTAVLSTRPRASTEARVIGAAFLVSGVIAGLLPHAWGVL